MEIIAGAVFVLFLSIWAALASREKKPNETEYTPPSPPEPPKPTPPEEEKPIPAPSPVFTPEVNTAPPSPSPDPKTVLRPWGTQKDNYHNVRVLCDRANLTSSEKNLICACVYQESTFKLNARYDNKKDGKTWSSDHGIVQINDYWNIGPGKPFPSIQYVYDNPEACVKWMIKMYKAGKLGLWSSYKLGHYKQWLTPTSPMWKLRS